MTFCQRLLGWGRRLATNTTPRPSSGAPFLRYSSLPAAPSTRPLAIMTRSRTCARAHVALAAIVLTSLVAAQPRQHGVSPATDELLVLQNRLISHCKEVDMANAKTVSRS